MLADLLISLQTSLYACRIFYMLVDLLISLRICLSHCRLAYLIADLPRLLQTCLDYCIPVHILAMMMVTLILLQGVEIKHKSLIILLISLYFRATKTFV